MHIINGIQRQSKETRLGQFEWAMGIQIQNFISINIKITIRVAVTALIRIVPYTLHNITHSIT